MATATIGNNTGNTFSGTDDTALKQTTPTTNYGSSNTDFFVHKFGSGDHGNAVITFTGLSNITGPVTVSSATLYLWQRSNDGAGTYTIEARRLLRNWVEAQATWNIYSTGNNWTTAGGESDGNDRVVTVSGSVSIGVAFQYFGITGAQLATDVENIINGVNSNFGWHISRQGTGEDGLYKGFETKEGPDTNRPYLDITYTAGGAAPTPNQFDALTVAEVITPNLVNMPRAFN